MASKDKDALNIGKVRAIDIDHEMQQAYVSYARSVICLAPCPMPVTA